jgi:hypothetical protein
LEFFDLNLTLAIPHRLASYGQCGGAPSVENQFLSC